MRKREWGRWPMCETDETGERAFTRDEMIPIKLAIGQRLLEVFGYQSLSRIIFRLRAEKREIADILAGKTLPSTELLLAVHKITGASIDWLLTGNGDRYRPVVVIDDIAAKPAIQDTAMVPPNYWFPTEPIGAPQGV